MATVDPGDATKLKIPNYPNKSFNTRRGSGLRGGPLSAHHEFVKEDAGGNTHVEAVHGATLAPCPRAALERINSQQTGARALHKGTQAKALIADD